MSYMEKVSKEILLMASYNIKREKNNEVIEILEEVLVTVSSTGTCTIPNQFTVKFNAAEVC